MYSYPILHFKDNLPCLPDVNSVLFLETKYNGRLHYNVILFSFRIISD